MPSPALSYFLSAKRDVVRFELIELSHPSFTQTYRRVRNHRDGITVTLETGATAQFPYFPMRITELNDQADLDMGFRIEFGDLGEVLPLELDAVYAADTMDIKPKVIYRCYRSDDLSAPLIGPFELEATSFSFTKQSATFEATAPYMNLNRTGETYNLTRFFTLRGFVR